jgi:hypothetical protein
MADLSIWQWAAIAVVIMGLITPVIAYKKNRPVFLWLALGVLFAPIPFFIILYLPSLPRPPYRPPAAPGELRMTE